MAGTVPLAVLELADSNFCCSCRKTNKQTMANDNEDNSDDTKGEGIGEKHVRRSISVRLIRHSGEYVV